MEYASNGKANAGLTTGIIGTSLAGLLTLGGMGGIGGLFGRPQGFVQTPEKPALAFPFDAYSIVNTSSIGSAS